MNKLKVLQDQIDLLVHSRPKELPQKFERDLLDLQETVEKMLDSQVPRPASAANVSPLISLADQICHEVRQKIKNAV